MTYYAKTAANGHQTTVEEHCTAVANMAKQFGAEIGREKEAYLAGLFHDFGKYGARFQEVLRGTRHHVDHAICGASILFQKYGRRSNWAVLEAVNGHHDGLLERAQLEARLRENVQNERPIENDAGKYRQLYAQARRRISSGKCFMMPSLGLREFCAYFELYDPARHLDAPIPEDLDAGLMVYDVFDLNDYQVRKKCQPKRTLFHAVMRQGVIEVPPYNSAAVIQGGADYAEGTV